MNKPFEGTIENMMLDLEALVNTNLETKNSEVIAAQTAEFEKKLLAMVGKDNEFKADTIIGNIESIYKAESYKCSFRRAMHIMFDTFLGGESCGQD